MLWKDIKWYLYTVIQYDNNCIHYNDFNCKAATNTDFYPVPFKWIFIIITGQIIKSLKLWSLLHLPSLSFPSALDQILHLAAFKSHLKTFFLLWTVLFSLVYFIDYCLRYCNLIASVNLEIKAISTYLFIFLLIPLHPSQSRKNSFPSSTSVLRLWTCFFVGFLTNKFSMVLYCIVLK